MIWLFWSKLSFQTSINFGFSISFNSDDISFCSIVKDSFFEKLVEHLSADLLFKDVDLCWELFLW